MATKTIKKTTTKDIKKQFQPGIERLEDGSIKLTMVLPWSQIEPLWDQVVDTLASQIKLPGFRPGKAPKEMIKDRLDKGTIREEVLKQLLPKAYMEAIQKHQIKPIMDPRIHVHGEDDSHELLEGKDWIFEAQTAESPNVDLGNYKAKVGAITAKSKIVVPGKEKSEPKFDEIINAFLDEVKVKVPAVLIERESDRLLAQSLDEIRKLGMTLDQYLTSSGRTAQDMRAEYAKKAQEDLKLEFALQKVAETEKIVVTPQEIQQALAGAKSDAERKEMEANSYLIATILRQQKTLDFLRSL